MYGGGARISENAHLMQCIISNNYAKINGGGIIFSYGGIISDCNIIGNITSNDGGGVYCDAGGLVNRCLISHNSSERFGGGVCFLEHSGEGGKVDNSIIFMNTSKEKGGGIYCWDGGIINNSTIVKNSTGNSAGGIFCSLSGTLRNSIVYYNSAEINDNFYINGGTFEYSCSFPLTIGEGNISNNPEFINIVSNDFRLELLSQCINVGTNVYAISDLDLDGNPRIVDGIVDMGAYEYIPEPTLFIVYNLSFIYYLIKRKK